MPSLIRTLDDQAAGLIRQRILEGSMPPGSRVREVGLAEELGVSRATLRSALQRLEDEHLIVQLPHRSTHVAAATADGIVEIYTLRNTLESLAARRAAQNTDADAMALIRERMGRMRETVARGDLPATLDADFGVHDAIVAAARHSRLSEHYRLLQSETRFYLAVTGHHGYGLSEVLTIHEQLVDAILAGDAERAEALGASHSTLDGERIAAALRAGRNGNGMEVE